MDLIGKNFETFIPEPCDCSLLSDNGKNDPNNNCNIFRFIHGVVYFTNPLEGLQLIQYYIDQYGPGGMVILFNFISLLLLLLLLL